MNWRKKITNGGLLLMGVYFKFANFTDEEVIDGYSAKSGEWKFNHFDQAVVVNYLMNLNLTGVTKEVKFIADESGEWDNCSDFKDVTAEVLYSMFEDGWFEYNRTYWNDDGIMKHILRVFQRADMENHFHLICDKIPEFDTFRKNMICEELEK
jgi:hypothetical protein